MSSTPSLSPEKKHWWLSSKKIGDKYIKDARSLIATREPSDVSSALNLLDTALSLSPRHEAALELKARCFLYLRRFKDVADMLQDYIPSFKMVPDDDSSTSLSSDNSTSSSQQLSRERVKLLSSDEEASDGDRSFRCFSVSDLKRKVLAGLGKTGEKEGQWRYLVLGQACSHLGMMEDAMVLLQTGKRLANAAFRRESLDLTDDDFSFSNSSITTDVPISTNNSTPTAALTESESAAHLLSHIKLLLRRRAAAVAALDAGLPTESVRHFSKILDGRRGTPHAFAANCLVGRAAAYRAAGRLAESIADCNRALALDPASIPALRSRADLLESVRCFPDCLQDLDHLKLLYDSILRDRKLPGPAWKPHHGIRYRDIPASLRALNPRIQELRQRIVKGEGCNVDYFALIGVRRGCTRSELERAHLLLSLKHRPDKAAAVVDRLEFADENRDLDAVRDQARMSALILYRLIQKGYSSIMNTIMDEEGAEKKRLREAAALQAAAAPAEKPRLESGSSELLVAEVVSVCEVPKLERERGGERIVVVGDQSLDAPVMDLLSCGGGGGSPPLPEKKAVAAAVVAGPVFQGVFCRDLAVVGNLLSQAAFNRPIQMPVKYEGLSC